MKRHWVRLLSVLLAIQSYAVLSLQESSAQAVTWLVVASAHAGEVANSQEPDESPEDRFGILGITVQEAGALLETLQKTVAESDISGLSDLVEFPLGVGTCDGEEIVENREDLARTYDDLIDRDLKTAILDQEVDGLFVNWQGVMIGSGEVWFTVALRSRL